MNGSQRQSKIITDVPATHRQPACPGSAGRRSHSSRNAATPRCRPGSARDLRDRARSVSADDVDAVAILIGTRSPEALFCLHASAVTRGSSRAPCLIRRQAHGTIGRRPSNSKLVGPDGARTTCIPIDPFASQGYLLVASIEETRRRSESRWRRIDRKRAVPRLDYGGEARLTLRESASMGFSARIPMRRKLWEIGVSGLLPRWVACTGTRLTPDCSRW